MTQVSPPCFMLSVALQFTEEDDFYVKAIRYRQVAFSFKLSTFGAFTLRLKIMERSES